MKKSGLWSQWKNNGKFIRLYLSRYRKMVFWGSISLAFIAILEVFPPLLLKSAVDEVITTPHQSRWYLWGGLYFLVAILQAVGRYGWRMFLSRAGIWVGRDLRRDYVRKLLSLSQSFYDSHKNGELVAISTNDIESMRAAIGDGVVVLVDAIFYLLTIPIAMLVLSPRMALICFLPLPLVPFLVKWGGEKIHLLFQRAQSVFADMTSLSQETILGIRVLKAFEREKDQARRFSDISKRYFKESIQLHVIQAVFSPSLDFVMSVGLVLLVYWGSDWVLAGEVSVGVFVAFQRYLQKIIWPMEAVGLAVSIYQRALASGDRFSEIMQATSDVEPKGIHPGTRIRPMRGQIEFKGLDFSYPGNSSLVLKNISLSIEPGERVGFVGPIGSGKTTLLSLIPKLYPVASNQLFVDGVDINQWDLEKLRSQIGFVSQDVFLFSGSVEMNILLGHKNSSRPQWLSENTFVSEALKYTQLSELDAEIRSWPEKYQTNLGERGGDLSGGQRQRLSLARALAKESPLLILDDSFSSVDAETEARLLKNLSKSGKKRTELWSAHRLETLRGMDKIVVMGAGQIQQVGTWEQVSQDRNGALFHFFEQLKLREEWDSHAEKN